MLRFTPAFFAAWTSLGLYNRADSAIPKAKASSPSSLTDPRQQFRCARAKYGKSIDLTLFTAAYAIDYLIETGLAGKEKPNSATWRTMLQSLRLRDPVVFATSAGVIMWAWFYYPASLPKSYRDWIAQVAQVDQRLVETLRDARDGKFIYGQKDRKSKALEEMCTEYAWPSEWADPATTIPVPCEVVHMGTGRSCHWHAAVRFVKAFYFAFKMSLPLQIILRSRKPTRKAAWRAVVESTRSSSFLGAFVAAFYYGVCLSRSLLGPSLSWILEVPAIFWDSGACVAMGCVLSGWTVLLEKTKRQQEMAMFVLPRALSVFFPRYYGEKVSSSLRFCHAPLVTTIKAFVIERLVFSCSIALLLTASSEGSGRVRGVLGKVLQAIVPRKTAMISK